jgi:hypothetical protein
MLFRRLVLGIAAVAGVLGSASCTQHTAPPPVAKPAPQIRPKPPSVPEPTPPGPPSDELEVMLRADPDLSAMLDEAVKRRVQILVAIPMEGSEPPRLRRIGFRVDAEYFYPASAVKIAAAYGAAEKLDDLATDARGRGTGGATVVGLKTPLVFVDGEGATRHVLKTTLMREMELALVSSDNNAFNRLFEFVGKNELAARLARIGLREARVVQHLGDVPEMVPPPPPAMELLLPGGRSILVAQRLGFEPPPAPSTDEASLGNAHVENGKKVARPMDFSWKNVIPLPELQDIMVAIARPDLYDRDKLHLSNERRQDLITILGMVPSQLRSYARAPKAKQKGLDLFHKPIHVSVMKALPKDRIKVLEKDGRAFGFSVENSYVSDETTHRSFFVAATIYANDDETLNDDQYDYESVGTPFLAKLGEVLARQILANPEK